MNSLSIVAPLALGVIGAFGSAAQALEISGSVTQNKDGVAIQATNIVAINQRTREVKQTTSKADGTYSIKLLPSGTYFVAALDSAESRHIYHAAGTIQNPFKVSITGDTTINFVAVGRDNTKPSITLQQPAASTATPIAAPTTASGIFSDLGDGAGPVAGVSQVVVGIGRNFVFGVPTEFYNWEARQFEAVDFSALGAGFTPANAALSPYFRVADRNAANSTFSASLMVTDAQGNTVPVFQSGQTYAVGAGAVDKAGKGKGVYNVFGVE